MPSVAASWGDALLLASVAQRAVGDLGLEVLAHLEAAEHPSDPHPNLVLAAQWPSGTLGGLHHQIELALGGGQ